MPRCRPWTGSFSLELRFRSCRRIGQAISRPGSAGVFALMIDCAVVGDSIALGVGTELHRCAVNAHIGIPSAEVIGRVQHANVLVVSAGSNDPHNPQLEQNLRAIRAKATGKVIWISPMDPVAAAVVRRVAK